MEKSARLRIQFGWCSIVVLTLLLRASLETTVDVALGYWPALRQRVELLDKSSFQVFVSNESLPIQSTCKATAYRKYGDADYDLAVPSACITEGSKPEPVSGNVYILVTPDQLTIAIVDVRHPMEWKGTSWLLLNAVMQGSPPVDSEYAKAFAKVPSVMNRDHVDSAPAPSCPTQLPPAATRI